MKRTLGSSILLAVTLVLANCAQPAAPTPQTAALLQAARAGNADTVRALLGTQGTDVNATDAQGNTALLEAARFGHDGVARALLNAGANAKVKDKDGKTALMLAVAGGHDDVVRVLKQAGVTE